MLGAGIMNLTGETDTKMDKYKALSRSHEKCLQYVKSLDKMQCINTKKITTRPEWEVWGPNCIFSVHTNIVALSRTAENRKWLLGNRSALKSIHSNHLSHLPGGLLHSRGVESEQQDSLSKDCSPKRSEEDQWVQKWFVIISSDFKRQLLQKETRKEGKKEGSGRWKPPCSQFDPRLSFRSERPHWL